MSDIEFTPATLTFGPPSGNPLAPIASTSSSSSSSLVSSPPAPANPQEDIIQKFMLVTKMNRDFSLKCLQENNFNSDAAYEVFKQLQAHNALPPEAFK